MSLKTAIGCRGVIIHEEKVLLTNDPTKKRGWVFPGGKMKDGELPEACVKREVKEETGIDVDIGEIFHTRLFDERNTPTYKADWFLMLYYMATPKSLELKPEEGEEAGWFTLEQVKQLKKTSIVLKTVLLKAGFWKEVQTTL